MAKVKISKDTCKGCGLCITACPKQLLTLDGSVLNKRGYHPVTITDESSCIACASCARICPDVVFEIEK